MLGSFTDVSYDVWNEQFDICFGEFLMNSNHNLLWCRNKNTIYYKFNEICYFIWLLRILNKSLQVSFESEFIEHSRDFFEKIQKNFVRNKFYKRLIFSSSSFST